MNQLIQLSAMVDPIHNGRRLDQVLADVFKDYSRSRLQSWVQQGCVRVDGVTAERP